MAEDIRIKDSLTYAGACHQARKMREFWQRQGHIVNAWVYIIGNDDIGQKVYGVRSNLINGLPRKRG